MPKQTTSFRLEEGVIDWLERSASAHDTTKVSLLEDALKWLMATEKAANANYAALWEAIAERYGEDAEILMWPVEGELGPEVRIRVNGEEPLDMSGQLTIDEARGVAHIFLAADFWSRTSPGSEYLGSRMFASLPMFSMTSVPWPPDSAMPSAIVARVGDVLHGGARAARDLAGQ